MPLVAIAVLAHASSAVAQVPNRVLHSFTGPDGADPNGALVETSDGSFVGTTWGGGEFDLGTAFRMTPNGTVTVLHSFAGGSDGARPGTLVKVEGDFYGTTTEGGTPGRGTIFKMSPEGAVVPLHEFAGGPGGSRPSSNLLLAPDGNFYGTTAYGGEFESGTIFRMSSDGQVVVIYSFPGGMDGESPGGLIQHSDGNFYGAAGGGLPGFLVSGMGILFRMTPGGDLTVLHRFEGTDGIGPGGMVQGLDGNLYGTTISGGASRLGTVFRLTTAGAVSVLHSFSGSPHGAYPGGGLIRGTDGALYGTTTAGGRAFTFRSTGTAFRITTAGAFSVLHVFQSYFDGDEPRGALLQASDGNLYGAARDGESGIVFRLDTLLCQDDLSVFYAPGRLQLGFTLHSWAPGTWSVWAFSSAGAVKLWSVPLPRIVPPAYSFGIGFPIDAPVGPLGILTTLTTPTLGSMCLDWKVVDTGAPPTTTSPP
jgi:uncharacterized repeat protein (TIGR03803 family)